MRVTNLLGGGICILLAIGCAHAQQRTVDCDAGDDLQQALDQAVADGLTWIAVEGTCEGNFELASPVNMTIDAHDATLVSPDQGTVFRVGGPGWVTLDGFEIRSGAVGVQSAGAEAGVIVRQCEVRDNGWGVVATRGARLSVSFSDIHDNDRGMSCDGRSRCSGSFATIRRNRSGVQIEGRSDLQSFGDTISENTESGVLILDRSTATFDQAAFSENGSFHLALNGRCDAVLQNGTIVGGPGDRTPLALATGMLSSAATSRFGEPVRLFGDVRASDSGYLILDATTVSGDVEVLDFGKVKLVGTTVAGSVVCDSGGDAVCGAGSSADMRGCAGARPNCAPRPGNGPGR